MTQAATQQPSFGVVILTMAGRPKRLKQAIASVLKQQGVSLDPVVLVNGSGEVEVPEGVRVHHAGENLGIPAGRNLGAKQVSGEYIFFLDDDSWLPSDTFLADIAARMAADPSLGMVQPRIIDPKRRGEEPRRWIPRLRKGDAGRSSEVFSVLETALVLPRATFDATGGWAGEFFYAHEGIELAWRVWDQGQRVEYQADLEVAHPVVEATRHAEFYYMNARNRVWLARRNLPWPISWAYVGVWTLRHAARRMPQPENGMWWKGWREGWRHRPWSTATRPKKLTWATVARMTRHGRPPII